MKTILVTAYAVNPYKGSEDGMGWNFVCQIARFNAVIALTRKNNRPHIERYQQEHPSAGYANITFLYYDLPYWMRFWKRGAQGAMLYYWMWQFGITRFIRSQCLQFDVAHNINFHNDWTPSYLWKLGKPFVWGPIGHHPKIHHRFLRDYPFATRVKEYLTWWIKKYFWTISPSLRKTVRKADHILCMNTDVGRELCLRGKPSTIMPSVASEDFGHTRLDHEGHFAVLSAGRLVALKGFDLTVEAFARFLNRLDKKKQQGCRLVIVGSGPERERYGLLADACHAGDHVRFIEWLPRQELMTLYRQASVFLFPSHEGAGMVVSEALSFGLPVICLDNAGPGEFITPACGIAAPMGPREEVIENLAQAIGRMYHDKPLREEMGKAARQRFEHAFHWNRRGETLCRIYENL